MNYAKNKAERLILEFKSFAYMDFDEYSGFDKKEQLKNCKIISTICCEQIIKALDDIECDENQNVMESINEEEKFYNNVIKEIEKL